MYHQEAQNSWFCLHYRDSLLSMGWRENMNKNKMPHFRLKDSFLLSPFPVHYMRMRHFVDEQVFVAMQRVGLPFGF